MQQEAKIKTEIRKYLNEQKIYFVNVPEGTIGSKPGDPDMVMCLDGQFIGLECKTPKGGKRHMQEVRAQQIEASGGICLFPRSLNDVKQYIAERRDKTP